MSAGVLDGRDLFACDRLSWPWEQQALAAQQRERPSVDDVAEGRPISARVNGGRWIVVCECGQPEAVWLDLPIFYCHNCWNRDAGGKWRPVVLPPEDDRREIERLLALRPYPNRAWWPGETVEDVRADNLAHGLEG